MCTSIRHVTERHPEVQNDIDGYGGGEMWVKGVGEGGVDRGWRWERRRVIYRIGG